MKSKLLNYLFWLVIAAAFIGPGTVTTAASAGASFQYQLIWAMLFSTMACLVLQESAARIAIVTGNSLGQMIRERFQSRAVGWTIGAAILLGCLAYEAGNILGAISGLALIITSVPAWVFTLSIGLLAFSVLYMGRSSLVANFLGLIVAIMGIAFFVAAVSGELNFKAILIGAVLPSIPEESLLITLGLIGTTIVPYNIFLGSSLAEGQSLQNMRKGLSLSVVLGGLISICVILVGANLEEGFSFGALFQYLKTNNGAFMGWLFAIGLFAAGFTSTITASMAGALTIRSVHPKGKGWDEKSKPYRTLWITVLLIGVGVGMLDLKPIPIIILAQAANGLILPLLTYAIWLIVNSEAMGDHKNQWISNWFMAITLAITTILGLLNVLKAVHRAFNIPFELSSIYLLTLGFISLFVVALALFKMKTFRSS